MKKKNRIISFIFAIRIFMIFLLCIVCCITFGHSEEFRYRTSTINSFIKAVEKSGAHSQGDFTYEMQMVGAEAKVVYTGESRQIEGVKRKLIDNYFTAIGRREMASFFQEEILVSEEGRGYWLPIEGRVLKKLKRKNKPNSEVIVAFVLLGTVKTSSSREWMLAVTR